MKPLTLAFTFLFSFSLLAQEKITAEDIYNKLLKTYYTESSQQKVDKDDQYENFLIAARAVEKTENSFTGKFNFGLTLNNSQNSDITQFNIAANIKRGFFPGEFKFNSELNIQLQNNTFIENFSDLSMSYDHHIGRKISWEGYTFLKRSTNNFLNIGQRYEVGVGGVWNIFLSGKGATPDNPKKNKRRLTEKGKAEFEKIIVFKISDDSLNLRPEKNDEFIDYLCNEEICKTIALKEEQKELLKNSLNRVVKSVQKKESKIRCAFLLGFNYETEKTNDDLQLFGNSSEPLIRSFDPSKLFRLVAGPIVDFQLDQFSLNSRMYFKPGISDDDFKNTVYSVEDTTIRDRKIDYRIEWNNSASIKFSKNISITASYRFIHINAPRRSIEIENGSTVLYSAANRFNNLKMGFEYKF